MRKIFFVAVLLAALAAPQAVQAQCLPWDPLSPACRQQDTYNIIADARRRHAVNQTIANIERGVYSAGRGSYAGGYGYPGVSRPIGRREGAVYGAGIGAAIGGAVTGKWRGAAGGAAGGAILGMVLGGRGDRQNRPLDCGKRKLSRDERESCSEIAAQRAAEIEQVEADRQEAAVRADYEARLRTGGRVYNHTGLPVDVLDGNLLVATLRPGQSTFLPEAREGYRAEMLIPDRSTPGRTVRVEASHRLANDRSGWVFTAPDRGGV